MEYISNIIVYEDKEEVGNLTIYNYDLKFRRLVFDTRVLPVYEPPF